MRIHYENAAARHTDAGAAAADKAAAGVLARIACAAEPFVRAERTSHKCQSGGQLRFSAVTDPLSPPEFTVGHDTDQGADLCLLYTWLLSGLDDGYGIEITIPAESLPVWKFRVAAWIAAVQS